MSAEDADRLCVVDDEEPARLLDESDVVAEKGAVRPHPGQNPSVTTIRRGPLAPPARERASASDAGSKCSNRKGLAPWSTAPAAPQRAIG